ncbi:S-layer-like y domain-containing protein [Filibacter tadaridae]|uniref:Endoglucanase n=1 Tax=Filibacter tadaridae TaxID=2483811 RepID=A0A3P5XZQ5_9BACL|nr:S-layer homology domain-containing protein [Filibacter tadaridae]VDC33673.1 Endoglucanase precursor [Filibacter tadaridae]
MSKIKTKNRPLKVLMAGAVALTPVLAVGVNADKASAATGYASIDALIADLNTAYDKLSDADQGHLVAAQNQINGALAENAWEDNINSLLKDQNNDNARTVVKELVKLLASSHSVIGLENAFKEFDKNVSDDNLKNAFGEDITKIEFVNFLVFVESNVFKELGKKDNFSSYYDIFRDVLLQSATSDNYPKITDGIRKTVKVDEVPTVLQGILAKAKITDDQKDAFVKLAKNYNPATPPVGGGGVTPPVTDIPDNDNGQISTTPDSMESNPQAVIDAINDSKEVNELVLTVEETQGTVGIPALVMNALLEKNGSAAIVAQVQGASYSIPVKNVEMAEAAKQLGVTAAELKLTISITPVSNILDKDTRYKVLSKAIDFKVELVAPDNKSVELKSFKHPITRGIEANSNLNPATTLGVVVQADGSIIAVPTYVNDEKSALLRRSTNSTYTLIEHSKTFIDVDKGATWAEEYVEKLASKKIVNGVSSTSFKPSKIVTRGEFAAILARGLGIVATDASKTGFTDVSTSQGVNKNGEITAVAEAGLIAGYKDGTFRPYEEITRDQAAIMISRAIDFIDSKDVKLDNSKKITSFKDYDKIGAASRTHVDKVYKAGYLDGYTDNTFRPLADANRAQTAKILYNFLQSIKFIN